MIRRVDPIRASAVVIVVTIVGVGLLTPGYRPWADAVSRLGASDEPYWWLWRAGFVGFGTLVVAGAPAIGRQVPKYRTLVALLVAGFGVTAAIAGLAPKDAPNAPRTLLSQVHVASTIIGGAALLVAMALAACFAASSTLRADSARIGTVSVVGVIAFALAWGTPIYGLLEIALLTFAVAWLLLLSALAPAAAPRRLTAVLAFCERHRTPLAEAIAVLVALPASVLFGLGNSALDDPGDLDRSIRGGYCVVASMAMLTVALLLLPWLARASLPWMRRAFAVPAMLAIAAAGGPLYGALPSTVAANAVGILAVGAAIMILVAPREPLVRHLHRLRDGGRTRVGVAR